MEACYGCWTIELPFSSFEFRYKLRYRETIDYFISFVVVEAGIDARL